MPLTYEERSDESRNAWNRKVRAGRKQRADLGVCQNTQAHGKATHGRLCFACWIKKNRYAASIDEARAMIEAGFTMPERRVRVHPPKQSEHEPRKETCECGERFSDERLQVCERCKFLDGPLDTQTDVISALRSFRWLTANEIAELAGVSSRSAYRALRKLRRLGRIESTPIETPLAAVDRTTQTWNGRLARTHHRGERIVEDLVCATTVYRLVA